MILFPIRLTAATARRTAVASQWQVEEYYRRLEPVDLFNHEK